MNTIRNEKKIAITVDNGTYKLISLIAKRRKERGYKATITRVVREILQDATEHIEGEREVKFRDLARLEKNMLKHLERTRKILVKQFSEDIDRRVKLLMLYVK